MTETDTTTTRRRFRAPLIISYTIISLAFTIPAAWVALYAACVAWPGLDVCQIEHIYTLTALGIIVLTLAPVGLIYRERALRRARRGMWQKVGPDGVGMSFQKTVQYLWGSEIEPPETLITGEMRFERRGWYILVKSGRRVWVDRAELWRWLVEVERLAKTLPAGESAIGERRWQATLGRDLWLAYCQILEAVGAVDYATDDLRSRRYVPGQPWGRVEEFEKIRASE